MEGGKEPEQGALATAFCASSRWHNPSTMKLAVGFLIDDVCLECLQFPNTGFRDCAIQEPGSTTFCVEH